MQANPSARLGSRGQSLDTVACPGNSVLDGLRADCQGSDTLAASDKDDLVAVAAR